MVFFQNIKSYFYSYNLKLHINLVLQLNFVEMNFQDELDNQFAKHDLIHIYKVNTRGRKCETKVYGIPEIFDYNKMLKFWKNNFQTNGRLCKEGKEVKQKGKKEKEQEDEHLKQEEIIVVNGGHRQKIKQFLVYMGISDAENIRVHGAS